MTIEFYTPEGEVREWTINLVKEKLTELHQKNKKISRAEVHFRSEGNDRVCDIDLIIYGDSLFIHRKAASYEQAAREVMKELEEKVVQQLKGQKEPPDEVTSSVSI